MTFNKQIAPDGYSYYCFVRFLYISKSDKFIFYTLSFPNNAIPLWLECVLQSKPFSLKTWMCCAWFIWDNCVSFWYYFENFFVFTWTTSRTHTWPIFCLFVCLFVCLRNHKQKSHSRNISFFMTPFNCLRSLRSFVYANHLHDLWL